MEFELAKALQILERTPKVLSELLAGLSDEWVMQNEGGESWSPYDIVGHLIHGERTDWIPRTRIILSGSGGKTFESFDRFAQFGESAGKSMDQLLHEFSELRRKNLQELKGLNLDEKALKKDGVHPELGPVKLKELLSAWVVHDLAHLAQISRVMAKQYGEAVGVWKRYMGILNR